MIKNILIITIALVIIALGCKKAEKVVLSSNIIGTWELRKSGGGAILGYQNFSPGNGSTLQFNRDSTFLLYSSFKLINQGTFQVIKNGITFGGITTDGLFFNHNTPGDILYIKSDSLSLNIAAYDAPYVLYVRQ
jgi:hypothetical protein